MPDLTAASRRQIRKILRAVGLAKKIICLSHIRADGDGLGAATACSRMLRKMGKRSSVACDRGTAPEYRFIPEADRVAASPRDLHPPYDAALSFDCATYERLGSIGEALRGKVPILINIDHHLSNTRFGSINWIDDSFASTTEMVYYLIRESGVRIDPTLATQVYVGLVTDTGSFRFSNTTPRSHRIAAALIEAGARPSWVTEKLYRQKTPEFLQLLGKFLSRIRVSEDGLVAWGPLTLDMVRETGANPQETQEFVDLLRSMRGVRLGILLRELPDGEGIKVSFRTSEGVDGLKLASIWGGGGHRRASGALLKMSLEEAERDVVARSVEFVRTSPETKG